MSIEEAAEEAVRVPEGIMRAIEASYGTRQRQLDWLLAIASAVAVTLAFGPGIARTCGWGRRGPGGGEGDFVPNADVAGAVPNATASLYTYNMPSSRKAREGIVPSVTAVPADPAGMPTYP